MQQSDKWIRKDGVRARANLDGAETVRGRGAARLRTVRDTAPPGSRMPSSGSNLSNRSAKIFTRNHEIVLHPSLF